MKKWIPRAVAGAILGTGLFAVITRKPKVSKMETRLQKNAMRFVQATNYTKGPRREPPNTIVIHTIESPEDVNRAYNTAQWTFAGPNARKASTHFLVDCGEVVQAVREDDIAWGAEGANARGLHIEHAGMAGQGPAGWKDAYTLAMLERSAELTANLAVKYNIPIRKLTWEELKTGEPGFVGHVDVNLMKGNGTMPKQDPFTHWDPGPNFPWDWYLERVKHYADQGANPAFANA